MAILISNENIYYIECQKSEIKIINNTFAVVIATINVNNQARNLRCQIAITPALSNAISLITGDCLIKLSKIGTFFPVPPGVDLACDVVASDIEQK